MRTNQPLYNSRVTKTYLEYLQEYYPHLDTDQILQESGMECYEVEDPAHWFSQEQVDAFHDVLVEKTKNPNISREAGQYGASSKGLGPIKQYALGLINPSAMFMFAEKMSVLLSRGAVVRSKKLGRNRVEVISIPTPETKEKPYQCENRIGYFESMVRLFVNSDVSIEHPTCIHKGDAECRYVVKWKDTLAYYIKKIRNCGLLVGLPLLALSFFLLTTTSWGIVSVCYLIILLAATSYSLYLENKKLTSIIRKQGVSARNHLYEINKRYLNALLIQKIGELTSTIISIDFLTDNLAFLLDKHIEYESGFIALINEQKTLIKFKSGFGLTNQQFYGLKTVVWDLKELAGDNLITDLFQNQKTRIFSENHEAENSQWLSSLRQIKGESARSVIVVPIVYETETLGILSVCSNKENRVITKSDINLLSGIASQLANGIVNLRAYKELRQSEEKYRTLVETTDTGFSILDRKGRVIDANDEYVRLSGHKSFAEIKGRSVQEWTATHHLEKSRKELENLFKKGFVKNFEIEYKNPAGGVIPVEINASVINIDGVPCSLALLRDITEQRKAREMLIQSEKMTTVGGLATGMAHEINNPLAGILQTVQVLRNRLTTNLPKYEKLAQQSGTTIEAVRSYHQKLNTFSKIEDIIAAGRRAANIVNNMLTFSHKSEAYFVHHDVSELLDKTVEIAKSDYDLQADYDFKDVEIIREYEESVPKVPCSSGKIQQVFLNLLKNGVQEMKSNNPKTRKPQFILKVLAQDDNIRVEISDNGPGMTEEVRKRIFEPFYTTKTVGTGIGLGLSISYFIIKENHGGDMIVESSPGKGTKFIILLPLSVSTVHS
ncbi:PAS domain S-box protein [bacterium]|nr:PAS domain S-box protein [bacterium]